MRDICIDKVTVSHWLFVIFHKMTLSHIFLRYDFAIFIFFLNFITFLSSCVLLKQGSNVVVAANSQGTIKVMISVLNSYFCISCVCKDCCETWALTPSLTVILAIFTGSRAGVESLMSGPIEQANICTPLYIKQSQEPNSWQSFIVELVIVIFNCSLETFVSWIQQDNFFC